MSLEKMDLQLIDAGKGLGELEYVEGKVQEVNRKALEVKRKAQSTFDAARFYIMGVYRMSVGLLEIAGISVSQTLKASAQAAFQVGSTLSTLATARLMAAATGGKVALALKVGAALNLTTSILAIADAAKAEFLGEKTRGEFKRTMSGIRQYSQAWRYLS